MPNRLLSPGRTYNSSGRKCFYHGSVTLVVYGARVYGSLLLASSHTLRYRVVETGSGTVEQNVYRYRVAAPISNTIFSRRNCVKRKKADRSLLFSSLATSDSMLGGWISLSSFVKWRWLSMLSPH